uniref:Uncharacterized protein n=1 Tax=Timema douglasi TaxID=61478 RepID=A0A7R8VCR0_TIMDO|nr:unnamed protein product [Timema douglasi]
MTWRLHQPSDEDAGSSVEHTLTILNKRILNTPLAPTSNSAAQCDTVECYWSTAFKREGVKGGPARQRHRLISSRRHYHKPHLNSFTPYHVCVILSLLFRDLGVGEVFMEGAAACSLGIDYKVSRIDTIDQK